MSAPDVRLVVGNVLADEFKGWESFEVESDLLQPADAFSFVAQNIGGKMAGKISFHDTVQVVVDDAVVMQGFVDDVTYKDGRINIVGRDDFGHLVDCSADPKTYRNMNLKTLAGTLASNYIDTWKIDPLITLPTHRRLKVEPGETIADVLIRVAKKDRVLIWLDETGVAHIGRPNYDQAPAHVIRHYVSGGMAALNNVKSAEVRESGRGRYSRITVLGASGNSSSSWGKTALQKQTDTDAEVTTTRNLILTDGDVGNISQAKNKAIDEVDRRAFEGTVLNYTAFGFYGEPAGGEAKSLFAIDQRVAVTDEEAGIDGVYYLSRRRLRLDIGTGHTTELELHPGGWMA